MRKRIIVIVALAAATAATTVPSTGAAAAVPASIGVTAVRPEVAKAIGIQPALPAFRSVDVSLINRTGCDLTKTGAGTDHGIFTSQPPELIEPDGQGFWASESNGFLTGTEGWTTFRTSDCDIRDNRRKNIYVHWSSPWIGSANYSAEADSPVEVTYNGDTGNNSQVTFFATIAR
jgi:hypothetical protein